MFGGLSVDGVDQVLDNWEALKRKEKGRDQPFKEQGCFPSGMTKNLNSSFFQDRVADPVSSFNVGAQESPIADNIDQTGNTVGQVEYPADQFVGKEFFVMPGYGQAMVDIRGDIMFIQWPEMISGRDPLGKLP